MNIGIVSDSHGSAERLSAALRVLRGRSVDAVLHCGDLESAAHLKMLGSAGGSVYAVAGNMDKRCHRALRRQAERMGAQFAPDFVTIDLGGGRHLAATHGHLEFLLDELVVGQQFAYVCHGHTHRRRDERHGAIRVLNPGALHHPRDGHAGCLLLDTDSDTVEFLDVGP